MFDTQESTESNERISPIMAVDGVGKVLLVSGDDSSITSIISVSTRLRELVFEANEIESIVVEKLDVAAGATFFAADDEEGRKSLVTDSDAIKGKKEKLFNLNFYTINKGKKKN